MQFICQTEDLAFFLHFFDVNNKMMIFKQLLNKLLFFNDNIDYNKFLLKYIFYTIRSIIYHPRQQFSQNIQLSGNRHRDIFNNNLLLKNIRVSFQTTRNNCFSYCKNLQCAHIVNSKIIPPFAFSNCENLKLVVIDQHILKIKHNAFMNCHKLETVYISKNIKYIQTNAFMNCTNLKNVFFF